MPSAFHCKILRLFFAELIPSVHHNPLAEQQLG